MGSYPPQGGGGGVTALSGLSIDTDKNWGGRRIENLGAPTGDAHAARRQDVLRGATKVVAANNSIDKTKADYVCDGTGDQVEINAAIAALGAVGGTVILLEGTYNLSSAIDILTDNVTLRGNGPGTVIRGAIATSYIRVGAAGAGRSDVVIRDLKIDGSSQTTGYGISFEATGTRVKILNCTIDRAYQHGITGDVSYAIISGNILWRIGTLSVLATRAINLSGNNIIISDNVIDAPGGPGNPNGIYLSSAIRAQISGNCINTQANGSSTVYLTSCTFISVVGNYLVPHDSGVYGTGSTEISIVGNVMIVGTQSGVLLMGTPAPSRCVVANNVISDAGAQGIRITGGGKNCIIGNSIYSSDCEGIRIDASSYNVVSGNSIHNSSGGANNLYDDIYLVNTSTYNSVVGNTILSDAANRSRYGINEAVAADNYNVIEGNVITGPATGTIRVQGAESRATDNMEAGVFTSLERSSLTLMHDNLGITAAAPGVAYTEPATFTRMRTAVDFTRLIPRQARVVVSAVGNEAGVGKGVEIYNVTDAASVCEVTWNGNAEQNALAGAWTSFTPTAEKTLAVRVKGSSVTENITVYKVEVQFR